MKEGVHVRTFGHPKARWHKRARRSSRIQQPTQPPLSRPTPTRSTYVDMTTTPNLFRDGPREELTSREIEVLALLPTRLTTFEIAGQLFISVNTVKTHIKHVYRKLESPDRNSAILRAQYLGLLNEGL